MTALLAAAALLLALSGVSVVALLSQQRRQQALDRRVASFRSARPKRVAAATVVRDAAGRRKQPIERVFAVFGYAPARRDQYGLPWIVVLGAATLVGRLAVMLGSGVAGVFAWVLLPLCAIGLSRAYYGWADGNRRGLLLTQFPDALALIVRAVRVGIPVPEALRAAARESPEPTRTNFDRLQQQIGMGVPIETALRDMADANNLPEYSFFAAALALQAQTGGGLTATLETLAEIIRKRIAMKERGHALSSEARTSSMVLGALPLVAGALLYFVSPDYISLLFTDPSGHMILGLAVLSLATGMFAMRVIIRKALS